MFIILFPFSVSDLAIFILCKEWVNIYSCMYVCMHACVCVQVHMYFVTQIYLVDGLSSKAVTDVTADANFLLNKDAVLW